MRISYFNQSINENSIKYEEEKRNPYEIFVRCYCSAFFHGLILGCLTSGLILAILITFWLIPSNRTITSTTSSTSMATSTTTTSTTLSASTTSTTTSSTSTTATSTTTSSSPVSLTSANEDVYGIWNTTAGGDSIAATAGSNPGNYPPFETPQMAVDSDITSKYLSYGTCSNGAVQTIYCGLNTGFYVTPKYGSSLVIGLQFCTANDFDERDATMATLEGSNQPNSSLTSGSSWTLIYSGTLGLDNDPGRRQCGQIQTISNTVRYTSYRILVTDKRAKSFAVQYSEVRLIGY